MVLAWHGRPGSSGGFSFSGKASQERWQSRLRLQNLLFSWKIPVKQRDERHTAELLPLPEEISSGLSFHLAKECGHISPEDYSSPNDWREQYRYVDRKQQSRVHVDAPREPFWGSHKEGSASFLCQIIQPDCCRLLHWQSRGSRIIGQESWAYAKKSDAICKGVDPEPRIWRYKAS